VGSEVVIDGGMSKQDIELPQSIADGLRKGGLSGGIPGVRGDNQYVAAKFLASRIQSRGVCSGDRNACAFAEKLAGRFEADTGGPTAMSARLFLSPSIVFFTKRDDLTSCMTTAC